jgi:hypothetical protein
MKSPIDPATSLVDELLLIRSDGSESRLTIRIGLPVNRGDDWACPCEIDPVTSCAGGRARPRCADGMRRCRSRSAKTITSSSGRSPQGARSPWTRLHVRAPASCRSSARRSIGSCSPKAHVWWSTSACPRGARASILPARRRLSRSRAHAELAAIARFGSADVARAPAGSSISRWMSTAVTWPRAARPRSRRCVTAWRGTDPSRRAARSPRARRDRR